MPENRSFDCYFDTYPAPMRFPPGVCVPDLLNGGCVSRYDPSYQNFGESTEWKLH